MDNKLRVLLVEDNETHAHLVRRRLMKAPSKSVDLHHAETLREAVKQIAESPPDAVLLDLSLPDSEIAETLSRFIDAAPTVPVVVLTSLDDLDFASELVHQGADDFLVKSDIHGDSLLRSIRYAIERKKNRQELAKYAARLQRSNEELKSFAHTIAHEVRSPLNVVYCCLQLIEMDHREQLSADSAEAIQDAKAAIDGMSELVTDLLEYSRVEKLQNDHASVDMKQVFEEAAGALKSELVEAGAALICQDLPTIEGNQVQLRQLLRNLIGNAIKYRHPERTPRIEVSAREAPRHWQFTVADNGLGIAPEDQQNVFGAFIRVHEATGIAGTGIGLSFCHRIVDNHDGRIWVESLPEVGSQFHFTLPKNA